MISLYNTPFVEIIYHTCHFIDVLSIFIIIAYSMEYKTELAFVQLPGDLITQLVEHDWAGQIEAFIDFKI